MKCAQQTNDHREKVDEWMPGEGQGRDAQGVIANGCGYNENILKLDKYMSCIIL